MSTSALPVIGRYLWTLRDGRGISRLQLGEELGTNDAQIGRIEKGEIDTRGTLLLQMIQAVGGSAEHIKYLATSQATEEDAIRLANSVLGREGYRTVERFVESLQEDELDEIIEVTHQLRSSPGRLAKWLGFGRGLSEK